MPMKVVKAAEIVCPKCKAKLIYTAEVHGNIWFDVTDDGLVRTEDDLEATDEFFICPNDHEVPCWMYTQDVASDDYLKFDSVKELDAWYVSILSQEEGNDDSS